MTCLGTLVTVYVGEEAGQGSIEAIAGVAALVVVCAVIIQIIVLGSAWLDAQSAARVADRAYENRRRRPRCGASCAGNVTQKGRTRCS